MFYNEMFIGFIRLYNNFMSRKPQNLIQLLERILLFSHIFVFRIYDKSYLCYCKVKHFLKVEKYYNNIPYLFYDI